MSWQESFARLQQEFDADDDDVLECTERKLNLICSYTGSTLLRQPVIGSQCKHYKVFCLKNFVDLNRSAGALWQCPGCKQRAVMFKEDALVKAILEAVKAFFGWVNEQEVQLSGA